MEITTKHTLLMTFHNDVSVTFTTATVGEITVRLPRSLYELMGEPRAIKVTVES